MIFGSTIPCFLSSLLHCYLTHLSWTTNHFDAFLLALLLALSFVLLRNCKICSFNQPLLFLLFILVHAYKSTMKFWRESSTVTYSREMDKWTWHKLLHCWGTQIQSGIIALKKVSWTFEGSQVLLHIAGKWQHERDINYCIAKTGREAVRKNKNGVEAKNVSSARFPISL